MRLGHRFQLKKNLTMLLLIGILLVLGVPGVRANPLYQTVPTMPPPTKSPTVTAPNTPISTPANSPTSPALPSPTDGPAINTPLTPTTGAVVSTAAPTYTATMAETTSIPIESPTSIGIGSDGSVVPQTEFPIETAGFTRTPVPGTSMEGISQVWLLGLVIALVVLGLAAGLAWWMLRRRNQGDGNDTARNDH